jgi:hypothetical protein
MDRKSANKLKIGQRVVIWEESPDACSGTITEKNWMAIKVEWDDGQIGIIHLDDCRNVSPYLKAEPIIPVVKAN